MSVIGDNLALLRKRVALSQTQVAQALGVRQASVSDWERGAVDPGPANLAALSELFGFSPAELMTEDLSKKQLTWADHTPPHDRTEATRRVRALVSRLEGDMHEWGGTDVDIEAARMALATDETVRLLARLPNATELAETFETYVRFVEALRLAFGERILRRHDGGQPAIRELGPLTPVPRSTPSSGARRSVRASVAQLCTGVPTQPP